ncbi:MAG: hypothetical protein AMXMBFR59_42050 [Rhodanobacteraceae bacterium]
MFARALVGAKVDIRNDTSLEVSPLTTGVQRSSEPVAHLVAVLAVPLLLLGTSGAYGQSENAADAQWRPAAEDQARRESTGSSGRQLEEVVVTAQRQEQNQQDVPISMSVVPDTFIAERGVTDVKDLLSFTPNVRLEAESGAGAGAGGSPNCRGFRTSTSNRSFEAPCGIALDGIPYSRSAFFSAALFDIQRVEVLRGPQGTNFGKNTTAGLIHVISKDPTDYWTGHADIQHGELERQRYELGIGGPLVDGVVNFRVAALKESRDGFMKNTTAEVTNVAPGDQGSRDREGVRVKFEFPNVFGSSLKLSYENIDLLSQGTTAEYFDVTAHMAAFFRRFDPNADFEQNNRVNSTTVPSKHSTRLERYQADWSYDARGWGIDATLGHARMEAAYFLDVFGAPPPIDFVDVVEKNPTTTFELRALSPSLPGLLGLEDAFGLGLGRSEILTGFFYQKSALDPTRFTATLRDRPALVFLTLPSVASTPGFLTPEQIRTMPDADLYEAFGVAGFPEGEAFTFNNTERRETVAGFTQLKWQFAEQLFLQTGLRYSEETKHGTWDQRPLNGPAPIHTSIVGWHEFTASRSRKESNLQPKVTLGYTPTDNANVFLHWAKGFKAGGFNSLARYDDPLTPLSYGPESVTEWGIDAKVALLDQAMRLNISLFRMELDDYQIYIGIPASPPQRPFANSVVVNAGKTRAQGFEADLTYLPTDWLTVIAAVGMNDAKFIDFPFGPCPTGVTDSDGDGFPACNRSGDDLPFNPKWSGSLALTIHFPLAFLGLEDLNFLATPSVQYSSSQIGNDNLDELTRLPSFYRVNAGIGIENPRRGWSLRIVGENLTDDDTPTSLSVLSYGKWSNAPEPRTFFAQLRWEF